MSSPQPPQESSPLPLPHPCDSSTEENSQKCAGCHNCGVSQTPVWRRDPEGMKLCNACGLFLKIHKSARPVAMNSAQMRSKRRYIRLDLPDIESHVASREDPQDSLGRVSDCDHWPALDRCVSVYIPL
ncbi:hypothetical protein CVT26_012083 [Gymnopilus dilepis]|uniref:GATA-type domain-containing protein n=1 Tax=Gymnopilus dilepis TaxID=231916 RepID=A0A409W9F9_9AGAR|nr:hypothetical protein CVT26_012083 [Gymnopilus dilepis]